MNAPDGRGPGRHQSPPATSTHQAFRYTDTGGSIEDELTRVVVDIRQAIPELTGVMIASDDGLPVCHDFPEEAADRVAAMAATALGLGTRISQRTALGALQEAVVRGDDGYLVVYAAGQSAALVLKGPRNSNLGLMRIEARAASAHIRLILP